VATAVVLIALGVLFLLANMGWLDVGWISHSWPVILIAIGVWLLWKRLREPAGKGNQQQ
jgi:ABC-type nickel/cobalt efflux system permease component RcnA